MKVRRSDLTPEAAKEDALSIMRMVCLYFDNQLHRVLPDYLLNLSFLENDEVNFNKILDFALRYCFLKKDNKDNTLILKKIEKSQEVTTQIFFNEGLFIQEMQNLYSFAALGHEAADVYSAKEFRLRLIHLLFSPPITVVDKHYSYSFDAIERHFPRLAHALRLADARLEIELIQDYERPEQQYISPSMLALLGDLTYMGIIKKIKSGEIPATKEEGEWRIPLPRALEWLKKREQRANI